MTLSYPKLGKQVWERSKEDKKEKKEYDYREILEKTQVRQLE